MLHFTRIWNRMKTNTSSMDPSRIKQTRWSCSMGAVSRCEWSAPFDLRQFHKHSSCTFQKPSAIPAIYWLISFGMKFHANRDSEKSGPLSHGSKSAVRGTEKVTVGWNMAELSWSQFVVLFLWDFSEKSGWSNFWTNLEIWRWSQFSKATFSVRQLDAK